MELVPCPDGRINIDGATNPCPDGRIKIDVATKLPQNFYIYAVKP